MQIEQYRAALNTIEWLLYRLQAPANRKQIFVLFQFRKFINASIWLLLLLPLVANGNARHKYISTTTTTVAAAAACRFSPRSEDTYMLHRVNINCQYINIYYCDVNHVSEIRCVYRTENDVKPYFRPKRWRKELRREFRSAQRLSTSSHFCLLWCENTSANVHDSIRICTPHTQRRALNSETNETKLLLQFNFRLFCG